MPHLSIRRQLAGWVLILLGASLATSVRAQTSGSAPNRLVDFIDVTEHENQADINIQFSCSLTYVTHFPAAQGPMLRITLRVGPDCGFGLSDRIPPELPPVSGGEGIIKSATVDSDIPTQITLTLTWQKNEIFVLVQGGNRGLRIRLIDRVSTPGKVFIGAPPSPPKSYAINLESQPKEFETAAIELARQRLTIPVFVSESEVDGQKWYRLRAGPLSSRDQAERLLKSVLSDYPRAWLAINDEAPEAGEPPANEAEKTLPSVETIGSDPPLDAATQVRLLKEARTALEAKDYPKAIRLLTQLQRQPEFPQRSQAQELLGLAHERAGQLAHAKAEYEEYLRRYPNGEAAERVRLRLRTLRIASLKEHTGSLGEGEDQAWHVAGSIAQLFRYDGLRVDNTAIINSASVPTTQTTNQNALFNDVDVLARHKGKRIDMVTRLSAGYTKGLSGDNVGSQSRVTTASLQLSDSVSGLLARVGRQSRNSDGVLGTFDGLFASYQFAPSWVLNSTIGLPVEQTNAAPNTQRRFVSVALGVAPPGAHWDASVFGITQRFDGFRDRQAVGFEGRYLGTAQSLVGFVDYDTYFRSLNSAVLLGSMQLPDRWNLSFDIERRNSPVLTLRNALIGQPTTTLSDLGQIFTQDEILQLAQDRTAISSNYSLSASRPIGQRFQFAGTVAATQLSATAASGGVAGQPATGLQLSYQAQFYGSNLWTTGDFNVLNLLYADTEVGKLASLGITSRVPVGTSWRVGPRLTINRRVATDSTKELTFIPALLVDAQRNNALLQFEIGGQLGKLSLANQTQNSKRYYVSLSYRIGF